MKVIKQFFCGLIHGHDWTYRYTKITETHTENIHKCHYCGAKKVTRYARRGRADL